MPVRLSRILLEALDSPLRKWASLPITLYAASRYSIVVVEWRWCGIAYNVPGARPATTPPVNLSLRLLARMSDEGPVERSLAIAGLNAATAAWLYYTVAPKGVVFEPCLLDLAGVRENQVVVMAGFMEPLARRARERGARIVVLENSEELRRRAAMLGYEVAEDTDVLREADHFFMSGSSLVEDPERTVRELREASSATRILVGPTASFHPLVAARLGADIVAGSLIPLGLCDEAWRMIAAGHGAHSLSRRIRLVKWAAQVHEVFI